MTRPTVICLIVAAGSGSRAGGAVAKQYRPLGRNGSPATIEEAARRLGGIDRIDRLLIAVAPGDGAREGLDLGRAETLACGGETRARTVLNALETIGEEGLRDTLVLVHDAARPLVAEADVKSLIERALAARENDPRHGAALAIRVSDTVRRTDADGRMLQTVPREGLVRVATPQAFDGSELLAALRRHPDLSDESGAMLAAGGTVHAVMARPDAFKITYPEDLAMARELYSARHPAPPELRVGLGYDSHRLTAGRPLIIGGVSIDHPLGLEGHSDADVLTHAVIDALLGAAGQGDIGLRFPDSDPAYANADSVGLLRLVWDELTGQGWRLMNLDCVLIAQKPKLSPWLPAIARRLSEALGTTDDRISVKPKTNEGMGFEGREEGISAEAVALLSRERAD